MDADQKIIEEMTALVKTLEREKAGLEEALALALQALEEKDQRIKQILGR